MNDFRALIETNNPDVFCVTETWFTNESDVNVNGYNIYRKDRSNGKKGGGVSIYTRNSMQTFDVNDQDLNNQSIEQVWICINCNEEKILVGCMYRPPDSSQLVNDQIISSINAAKAVIDKKLYTSVVIIGDFNYNTLKWDMEIDQCDNVISSQDNQFLDCIENSFLIQCIVKPTFQRKSGEEKNILDLVIVDDENRLFGMVHSPPLGKAEQGHHVLKWFYKIMSECVKNKEIKEKLLYDKGNYEEINKYFSEVNWIKEFKSLNINQSYSSFLKHYYFACATHIPRSKIRTKNGEIWMTKELKSLIKTKNKFWISNKALKWSIPESKTIYNKMKREVTKNINTAVRTYEQNLMTKVKLEPKLLYAYINKKQKVKNSIKAMVNQAGEMCLDPIEIANILNNYFGSVSQIKEDDCIPVVEMKCSSKLEFIDVNKNKVKTYLSKLDIRKSIGFDEVHPQVLKNCDVSISLPLSLIFEKSLQILSRHLILCYVKDWELKC